MSKRSRQQSHRKETLPKPAVSSLARAASARGTPPCPKRVQTNPDSNPDDAWFSTVPAKGIDQTHCSSASPASTSPESLDARRIDLQFMDVETRIEQLVSCETPVPTERQIAGESRSDRTVTNSQTDPIGASLQSLCGSVEQLPEKIHAGIQGSLSELSQAQATAVSSQAEVLRTLTQVILTSSSSGGASLGEIESLLYSFEERLSDTIRRTMDSAVESLGNRVPSAGAAGQSSTYSQSNKASANHAQTPPTQPQPAKTDSARPKSWDEIRREYLKNSPGLNGASASDSSDDTPIEQSVARSSGHASSNSIPVPSTANTSAESRAAVVAVTSHDPELPFEVPIVADIDKMSESELRETIRSREKFLSMMIGRLRRQSHCHTDLITIEQLRALSDKMPAEFADRVSRTLQRLDEQNRMGELELSLERARISRQATQLEQLKQQIDHNARQLGWTVNADGTLTTNGKAVGKNGNPRRWLGKLGFGES